MSPSSLSQTVGTLEVAGRTVPRLGFGTMRLTGPAITGEPADRDEALRVARAAYDAGVRVFDTAWYYGPDTSSRIVAEALGDDVHDLLVVSKLGARRTEDGGWEPATGLSDLRAGAERECGLLGLDRLPVAHLRWMPDVGADYEDMLASMAVLVQEGLVEHVGLSTVSLEQLDHALDQGLAVATLSNSYGPGQQGQDEVLARCEERGIAYLPYFSLMQSHDARAGLEQVAGEVGATPTQVAIAWQLRRSPVLVPIPGTSQVAHLEENLAAADLELTDAQVAAVSG